MTIEAIGAIVPLPEIDTSALTPSTNAPTESFASWFSKEVGAVDTNMRTVDNEVRSLAVGHTQNLHEVMIHLEEAKLSFQLLAQVRNRVLEAYQEVMRTQV